MLLARNPTHQGTIQPCGARAQPVRLQKFRLVGDKPGRASGYQLSPSDPSEPNPSGFPLLRVCDFGAEFVAIFIAAKIRAAVRSATAITGSAARWAYPSVVRACLWPSTFPIMNSGCPSATAKDAKEWRKS